jgi:hypothetical protein
MLGTEAFWAAVGSVLTIIIMLLKMWLDSRAEQKAKDEQYDKNKIEEEKNIAEALAKAQEGSETTQKAEDAVDAEFK